MRHLFTANLVFRNIQTRLLNTCLFTVLIVLTGLALLEEIVLALRPALLLRPVWLLPVEWRFTAATVVVNAVSTQATYDEWYLLPEWLHAMTAN